MDAKLLVRFAIIAETAPAVQKAALKNCGDIETSKLLIEQNEKRLALIENKIKEIDGEAGKLLKSGETLQARFAFFVSIPGIAATTA